MFILVLISCSDDRESTVLNQGQQIVQLL